MPAADSRPLALEQPEPSMDGRHTRTGSDSLGRGHTMHFAGHTKFCVEGTTGGVAEFHLTDDQSATLPQHTRLDARNVAAGAIEERDRQFVSTAGTFVLAP